MHIYSSRITVRAEPFHRWDLALRNVQRNQLPARFEMQNILVLQRHGQIHRWIFQHSCVFFEAAVHLQRASLSLLPAVNSGDHVCDVSKDQVKIGVRFAGGSTESGDAGQAAGAMAAQGCC